MSTRRAFLDRSVGELRGVVTLDGRPERLVIRRDDSPQRLLVGARFRARVRKVEAAIGCAFLDLGEGEEAMLSFRPDERPGEGRALEVEIRTEARRGKLANVRVIGEAAGAPGLIAPAPGLAEELSLLARGAPVEEGASAREAADEAEAEALLTIHPLPGGGSVAIEPTRALVAIDVDVGERKGQEVKRVTRQANLAALGEAARLMRLKGLGGLVVIDLAGRGHDGAALLAHARNVFAPDNPGVAIGPVSRFGTMELTVPRKARPTLDLLLDESGRLSDRALAQRLLRLLEAEAAADRGARLIARCAPAVAKTAAPLMARLADRFGARFAIEAQEGWPRERLEASAR